MPARAADPVVPGGLPWASTYAARSSTLAAAATPSGSSAYRVPLICGAPAEQGEPSLVHVAVGYSPTSPFSVVTPDAFEFVSPAPATATKEDSDPRPTAGSANITSCCPQPASAGRSRASTLFFFRAFIGGSVTSSG